MTDSPPPCGKCGSLWGVIQEICFNSLWKSRLLCRLLCWRVQCSTSDKTQTLSFVCLLSLPSVLFPGWLPPSSSLYFALLLCLTEASSPKDDAARISRNKWVLNKNRWACLQTDINALFVLDVLGESRGERGALIQPWHVLPWLIGS